MESPTISKIKKFTDLRAWQAGHQLLLDIYKVTSSFPRSEDYGLTSQLRRAIVSVTSNVAEGFSRNTRGDKVQFYTIAISSLTEVENQLVIARDVGYINTSDFTKLVKQVEDTQKLISGLIKTARSWGDKK
ncbi:MAG TPA: four helix bundle protein [Candidatus Saccharimonadales bacterium]